MSDEEYVIILKNCVFMLADSIKYMKKEHQKQFKEAYEGAIKALEQKESVVKVLEDVRAEIILLSDKADRECKVSNSYSVRDRLRTKAQAYDDVAKMIDRKIAEVTKNE